MVQVVDLRCVICIILGHMFYVYLLTDDQHVRIYTGYTENIRVRLEQHQNGTASDYTRRYRTTKLVHLEVYGTRKEATIREREIKSYSTVRKHKLIQSDNPTYKEIVP